MEAAFNMMCAKNKKGDYCMQKGMEWEKKGAFATETVTEEFPDLCSINCTSKSAEAIKDLGCCFGTMLDMMAKAGEDKAEVKMASAVALKCGGQESLAICGGSAVPTAILTGKQSVAK